MHYDMTKGPGDVALLQVAPDGGHPNVAHFYGGDALKQAIAALESGKLGFRPTHFRVGNGPVVPIGELSR